MDKIHFVIHIHMQKYINFFFIRVCYVVQQQQQLQKHTVLTKIKLTFLMPIKCLLKFQCSTDRVTEYLPFLFFFFSMLLP